MQFFNKDNVSCTQNLLKCIYTVKHIVKYSAWTLLEDGWGCSMIKNRVDKEKYELVSWWVQLSVWIHYQLMLTYLH